MVENVLIPVDHGKKNLKSIGFADPSGFIREGGLKSKRQNSLANSTGDLQSHLPQVLEKEIA